MIKTNLFLFICNWKQQTAKDMPTAVFMLDSAKMYVCIEMYIFA